MRKIKEKKMIRSNTNSHKLKTIREDWKYKEKRRRQTKRELRNLWVMILNKLKHSQMPEFQHLIEKDTQL